MARKPANPPSSSSSLPPAPLPTSPPPWERQTGEHSKAFSAFNVYRKLKPHQRSIRNGVRELHGENGKISPRLESSKVRQWQKWSAKFHWMARVSAWEAHAEAVGRHEHLETIQAMTRRHVEEVMSLQEKAVTRLKSMRSSELSPSETLRFIIESIRLERLIVGEPDEIIEERVSLMEKARTGKGVDFSLLTDEELRTIIAEQSVGQKAERTHSPNGRES